MNKDELIKKIQEANTAYSMGIPFMTDTEYDVLWQQLHLIDPDNKLLYHTARNSAMMTGAIKHRYPVYGTNKAFSTDELKPFLTRFGDRDLIIEPKYDGCAVVIEHIQSGWQLTLEGDGLQGADISYLLPYIKCPFNLRHFQTVEVIIPFEDWNPDFGKNPRNTVAGWLNKKYIPGKTNHVPPIRMTAIPHNFGRLSQDYQYDGNVDYLNDLLLFLHTKWKTIVPIDGLMIKLKDEQLRLISGHTDTRNNWSIAWKPPIQTAITTVKEIEWNVSRLGRVIPTIIYDPIELCGTINRRVTGNNAQWILDKQISVGSTLLIGKAGEIIPKIIRVIHEK